MSRLWSEWALLRVAKERRPLPDCETACSQEREQRSNRAKVRAADNSGHRGSCSRSHCSRSVNVINGQTSLPGQPIRSDDIRIRLRSYDCGCDDGLLLACLAR